MNIDITFLFYNLANKFLNNNYFAYESPQESFFSLNYSKMLKVYSNYIELIYDSGKIDKVLRKRSIDEELNYYYKNFLNEDRHIFGWVNFEFCLEKMQISKLKDDTLLAVFFIPNTELRFKNGNLEYYGSKDAINDLKKYVEISLSSLNLKNHSFGKSLNINYRIDDDYQDRVAKGVLEIKEGKYDKIILSRKIPILDEVDFPMSYLNGRLANTPARSFLLKQENFQSFGFSPELVVRIENGTIITEPLAGTRLHKNNEVDNNKLSRELYIDPKEVFEHAISVKTSFEEIRQISSNQKAMVSEFMVIKNRGPVQHMASTVEGKFDTNGNIFTALATLFPSVTASGIPKKESIEAISRLDVGNRNLYSGAVGYVDPNGVFEMTLVLRSIFKDEYGTYLRAGAGIVSDSNPRREYEETCEKLSSIAPYLVKYEN